MRCFYAPAITLLLSFGAHTWGDEATLDVRLIVDVSRSMIDSDPKGMRGVAMGVFIKMLPHDSHAGIWTYGRYVNMLVEHAPVDSLWKQVAGLHVADLPSVGLRGDLAEAIARASWDRDVVMSDRIRHLVLLTDGRVNIADEPETNEASKTRLLRELLPQLKSAGIRVHSLALGSRADVELLKQLSMATGGYHAEVSSPTELPDFFLKVLDNVTPQPRLPISNQQFVVDPGVEEITIFRAASNDDVHLELVTPTGRRLSRSNSQPSVRWHVDRGYDLLTIENPQVGRWEFSGSTAKGSRVMVVGDIKPSISGLNATLFPGELKTFLIELVGNGERIIATDFLNLVEVAAVLETPSGERPLIVERLEGGEYKLVLLGLQEQGEHALRISARARTFERELRVPFLVSSPVTLDIRPRGSGASVWVALNSPDVNYRTVRVAAKIKRPPGAGKLYPAEKHPGGLWKFAIPDSRGSIDISVDISGNYLNKKEFRLRSDRVSFRLPLAEPLFIQLDSSGKRQLPSVIPIQPLRVDEPAIDEAVDTIPPVIQTLPAVDHGDAQPEQRSLVMAEIPEPETEPALPLWAALSVTTINLLLGFSVWFLLKVSLPQITLDSGIEALKTALTGTDTGAEVTADAAGA